ncbi:MAG: nucleotidyltransferase domain-containing protein [Acidobacteriota bacterium]
MVKLGIEMPPSFLDALAERLGVEWGNIKAAQARGQAKKAEIRSALTEFDSDDTVVVVFGSLARDEFTEGSDIDWTFLIDGSADPSHLDLAREIDARVGKAAAKAPGREGTFGTMAFSHDIIHQIGGQDDTNRNTTRRILLLLESEPVGRPDAYTRVVTKLVKRYILEDRGFVRGSGEYHVPRFLLNDFARYWWTMAVDFAYKQRTRFGEGAAIRNVKLRMSRKMTYVSGLLTCFGCHLKIGNLVGRPGCPETGAEAECIDCLRRRLRRTPLDILAEALLQFHHLEEAGRKLLGAYDRFLGILSDTDQRNHLEDLPEDQYDRDEVFQEARRVSHDFRRGLLQLFFDQKSGLFDLTKNYGVF